jgi:hypothetical protein
MSGRKKIEPSPLRDGIRIIKWFFLKDKNERINDREAATLWNRLTIPEQNDYRLRYKGRGGAIASEGVVAAVDNLITALNRAYGPDCVFRIVGNNQLIVNIDPHSERILPVAIWQK